MTTLYSGRVEIWNYETQQEVRSIQVTDSPVRAGKFITRKNWIVVGSDDNKVRVFNYNTGEKVADFIAHPDYIRSIAVHPSKPYILTGSDDLTIKLWNWEKDWALEQTFKDHEHFVMCVAFNPKDPNVFASGCLDHKVKVWSLGQSTPNFTLHTGQEKGVNYVDYYPLPDKPYLITSSDDTTVKIFDYQTKSCVATLEGHMSNVSYAVFHPTLPIIISGSEDGTVKLWNSSTYKLEKTLNLGLERSWCIATHPTGRKNCIASGFDSGFTVLSLGNDVPTLSLDPVGKLVWSGGKNASVSDIFTAVIRGNEDVDQDEPLPLQTKELGSVDVFPQSMSHSPNGRFVTVVGDGEFVIYTALAWRNKAFGKCQDFVWGPDSNSYALIDETGQVRYYKNFKEVTSWTIPVSYGVDRLFGGALLGLKSDGFTYFFDWDSGSLVRRIDVDSKDVIWSDNGELLMILNKDSDQNEGSGAYSLIFNRDVFIEANEQGAIDETEGVDEAFDVLHELSETVTSGKWVGDVFIYTTSSNRLNYFVGGKVHNLAHYTKEMYILGYLPRDNKLYLVDKEIHVYGHKLSIEVLEFQTLTLRGELEEAMESILPNITDKDALNKVARFLEGQEFYDEALEIATDKDHKFDLALKVGQLDYAHSVLSEDDSDLKWRSLGDAALQKFHFKYAIEAYEKANDLDSLFLLYSSFNLKDKLITIGERAEELQRYNLAFDAYWVVGEISKIKDLLIKSGRLSEAAIVSYTYGLKDEEVLEVIKQWKEKLILDKGNDKIASRICDTTDGLPVRIPTSSPLIDLQQDKPASIPASDTKATSETKSNKKDKKKNKQKKEQENLIDLESTTPVEPSAQAEELQQETDIADKKEEVQDKVESKKE